MAWAVWWSPRCLNIYALTNSVLAHLEDCSTLAGRLDGRVGAAHTVEGPPLTTIGRNGIDSAAVAWWPLVILR
jgi:hypothetical protein